MGLVVKKPGVITTIQDVGRFGYQGSGFSTNGVMDHRAFAIANLLVENDPGAPVLEFALAGPTVRFTTNTCFAITGGDFAPTLDGEPVPMYAAVMVRRGSILRFKASRTGCYGYLAIAGNSVRVPEVMGSRSTNLKCEFGGWKGRTLIVGDYLPFSTKSVDFLPNLGSHRIDGDNEFYGFDRDEITVRVVPGPQQDMFTDKGLATFYGQAYTTTTKCDRMGYRLDGPEIETKHGSDIISDGVAFGDNTMYLERCVLSPRHVEVQIIADTYGTVVALGERDCSVQRNHQKMIEESPSPVMTERVRDEMLEAAVRAAQAVGYTSAGTIEFLLDDKLNYYFMEMNTRIQVEHPVTEMVTGTDLVEEMIRVAAGDPLTFTQDDITYRGHAIECRVNAEQPERGFLPSPGTISQMHLPGGNGVRVDTAAFDGYEISPYYDSMIAKIIVHGRDRTEAIAKMRTALEEMVVVGVKTNLDFQYAIMENETFAAGHADTSFIERFMKGEV